MLRRNSFLKTPSLFLYLARKNREQPKDNPDKEVLCTEYGAVSIKRLYRIFCYATKRKSAVFPYFLHHSKDFLLFTFNKLKLHDLSSPFLCCSYEYFKHSGTDAKAPISLENHNGNSCSIGFLYATSESDLTTYLNLVIIANVSDDERRRFIQSSCYTLISHSSG